MASQFDNRLVFFPHRVLGKTIFALAIISEIHKWVWDHFQEGWLKKRGSNRKINEKGVELQRIHTRKI